MESLYCIYMVVYLLVNVLVLMNLYIFCCLFPTFLRNFTVGTGIVSGSSIHMHLIVFFYFSFFLILSLFF